MIILSLTKHVYTMYMYMCIHWPKNSLYMSKSRVYIALSSALVALRTLQPRAFGFLNHVDPLVSVSNCYVCYSRD